MDTPTDLITQLADPDDKKRRAAAEALRLLPSLPAEALFALKSATLDRNALVASSARAALAAHDPSLPPQKKPGAAPQPPALPARQGIKPKTDDEARLTGGFLLLLTAVLGYFGMFQPLADALRGAPSVTYYPQAAVLTAFGAFMGLSMVVFGIKGWAFLQGPTQRLPRILFFVAIVILTLACYFGMEHLMGTLGYR